MKTNIKLTKKSADVLETFEGGKAVSISKFKELERAVMSCLLWENEFYEDGESIADRIKNLISECIDTEYDNIISLLKKVKFDMRLRHCPLWMIVSIFNAGKSVSKELIASILTRPDDMGELLSLYTKDGKKPIPNQMKKGIALAFEKYDSYQLAKWNKNANYKLVDIANLCHPKYNESLNKLMNGTLETPDTWEVALSKVGSDIELKRNEWTRLISENIVGDMAFLKNIRGAKQCGVSIDLIKDRIKNINSSKLLPIDFIRAGETNPEVESEVEEKFFEVFTNKEKLGGRTAIMVDVSGSMYCDDGCNRSKYASALAMIGRELCENVDVYSFSNELKVVPNRHGFALKEAIHSSQSHCGTYLWTSVKQLSNLKTMYDRLIIITDEQSMDYPCDSYIEKQYIINIATYNKEVNYDNKIVHINGMSDKVYNYILEYERD